MARTHDDHTSQVKESETIEFKKSLAELGEGLNSMAAIFNKHGSGELWFGDILKTGKVSRRRNPLIADLLRRIHLVEARGRGIPLIREKAPDIRFSQVAGTFIAEFPRPVAIPEVPDPVQRVVNALAEGELAPSVLWERLGLKHRPTFRENYLRPAIARGLIEPTIPDKPNSRLQKYRLTEKGKKMKYEV